MSEPMTDKRLEQLESFTRVTWTQEEYKVWLAEACLEIHRLRRENAYLKDPLRHCCDLQDRLREQNTQLKDEIKRLNHWIGSKM